MEEDWPEESSNAMSLPGDMPREVRRPNPPGANTSTTEVSEENYAHYKKFHSRVLGYMQFVCCLGSCITQATAFMLHSRAEARYKGRSDFSCSNETFVHGFNRLHQLWVGVWCGFFVSTCTKGFCQSIN